MKKPRKSGKKSKFAEEKVDSSSVDIAFETLNWEFLENPDEHKSGNADITLYRRIVHQQFADFCSIREKNQDNRKAALRWFFTPCTGEKLRDPDDITRRFSFCCDFHFICELAEISPSRVRNLIKKAQVDIAVMDALRCRVFRN